MLTELQKQHILKELSFSTSRSSGPGGQHVNKVNTKVELRFCLSESEVLNKKQIELLLLKLANKITQNNELIITVQRTRSQFKNREEAIYKFVKLIDKMLAPEKIRKRTKPTLMSKKRRMESKKLLSQKKVMRKRPEI